mmetsp:Transcript_17829/g.39091  ORF Transcript_17829/g.39091 Transcript_17829/m.39091 type:complete len:468 (+) Transcript_17829:21-1424(+)
MQGCRASAGAWQVARQCRSKVASSRPPLSAQLCLSAEATQCGRRAFAGGAHFGGFPFGDQFGGQHPRGGDSDKFYKLLELEKGADDKQIKQAYKKQAMKHHPDRGGDEATFKEIARAYAVLSDPQQRQLYDTYGEEGLSGAEQAGGGAQGMDPFDLFGQIFGFQAGGRKSHRGRPVTHDSVYELQLSLEELYAGTTRNIVFTRDALCNTCEGYGGHDRKQCSRCGGSGRQMHMQQMGLFVQQVQTPCAPCGGKGYVIPAGKNCQSCKSKGIVKEKKSFEIRVESGALDATEYRFKGQADEAPGHDTGDVVIVVRQKPHKTFQRVKDSLLMSKKISLSEALCGFEISTQYLDGEQLVVRSKPGQVAKPGDILTVKGKGMPRPHGQQAGDLYLLLEVEFPKSMSAEAQDKLREVLGGKAVQAEPPLGAVVGEPLSQQRVQELKQFWAHQRAQENAHNGGGGNQSTCVHQ